MVVSKLKQVWMWLMHIFGSIFSAEDEKKHPWLSIVWIVALILAGAILWGVFFNWGNVPINYMDWAEVWAARMQAWRDALLHNTLPFHLSDLAAMRTESDRYFSVADMVSSPQVVLLRWLQVGTYAFINNLLLFGVGTYFLLLIRKKYNLSLLAFTFLFLLFNFNGFIVTHLSVGHLSWGGYYLLPGFVLFLLEMLEGKRGWGWVAKMAFLLFFMFLQGSFHQLVWCFIVLGILVVIRWRHALQITGAVAFTILLSMPRIIPAYWGKFASFSGQIDFFGGYPNFINTLTAMLRNSTPDMAMPWQIFNSNLGYWEFDIFIGLVGVLLIFGFGIISMSFWHYQERKFPDLIVPIIALAFLSIGDNFLKVTFSNPILASSERVTSRMMGLALVMIIILTAIYYQKSIGVIKQKVILQILQLGLLVVLIRDLVLHTLRWSVKNASNAFDYFPRDLSRIHVSNHPDPEYFAMLGIGLGISILAAVFLIWINKVRAKHSD